MAKNFNEATRVQMPALVHLTRLGYEYYGSGGNDPISDGNASPISWYFYDLDGNLLDHGGSF